MTIFRPFGSLAPGRTRSSVKDVSWLSRSLLRLMLAGAVLGLGGGCVNSRAFVPTEHVTGFSPSGEQYAAEYSLIEDGESIGEVKVWSDGASRDRAEDGTRTVVRVAFEITNQSSAPLRFDEQRLFLEETPEEGKTPGRERATRVDGGTLVPVGDSRQVTVTFALPSGVWPSDIPGYRVGWTVVARKSHSRKTPFSYVQATREADPWGPYYPAYPGYYYPGFYGSVGMGYRWPPPWRGPRPYPPYYYAPPYWR